jgi:hypothetical protein
VEPRFGRKGQQQREGVEPVQVVGDENVVPAGRDVLPAGDPQAEEQPVQRSEDDSRQPEIREADLHPLGMLGIQPHFGPDDPDGAALLASIVRTVLPLMERTGVATAREVAIETLRERLSDEFASHDAVFVYRKVQGARGTLR